MISWLGAGSIGREIVQNRLPTETLHFDRVGLFGFELLNDGGCVAIGHKLDTDLAIIAEGIGEFGGRIDGCYVPQKSKPKLPSLASIREENVPPTRKSTVE